MKYIENNAHKLSYLFDLKLKIIIIIILFYYSLNLQK